jgi:hypothetical protein
VRRTVAVVAAAGLVALGCSGGEDEILDLQATPSAETEPTDQPDEPEPDVEDTEEPVDEPEPDDPYAVPDEIDEDYVERVINAILEVRSEILRGALQQEQGENLDPDLMALHFATTEGTERREALDALQEYIDDPATRGGLFTADELGVSTFEIEYLHHAEPDRCMLAIGYWDRTGLSSTAPSREESLTAFSLGRLATDASSSPGNPTPWQWRDNRGVDAELSAEEYPDLPWDDVLDHICETLASSEGDG